MSYDLIAIGGGAAGEAVGHLGPALEARTAVVEADLVGGLCSFWACMPSKCLLDSAMRRHLDGRYAWQSASNRRDWMISRERIDYPDDTSHVKRLMDSGTDLIRGSARVTAPGRIEVRIGNGDIRIVEGRNIVLCTGSVPHVPSIDGLEEAGYWTTNEATSTRDLPSSIVIVGGGPAGVELAQVFVRFGSKVILVMNEDRPLPKDHPNSSRVIADQLAAEGVVLRPSSRVTSVRRGGAGRVVALSDGSAVEGSEVLITTGRRPGDLRMLGLQDAGVSLDEQGQPSHDRQMRIGAGFFVAGDAAGGLQFTHVAHYQGEVAARAAMGEKAEADLTTAPKSTFTDPESAGVGMLLEEARGEGRDAFEVTQDFSMTARGMTIEGATGHVTAVVDAARGVLVGVFAACTGAPELMHEAVLAIKQAVPVSVLADTIHAFPTGARVFGSLMIEASRRLR